MKSKPLVNADSQFFIDMTDESRQINFNGSPMPRGYYNLIVSIRDLGLYSKGIKPHRHWKITDVKKYFGIKGSAESMYQELQLIKEVLNEVN
jgi:hypothetical protein